MPSRSANRPPSTPDLSGYDLLAPQLSGGKDSAVMMAVFMEAARAAGVDDRVISYHASLGALEWPPVVFDGIRYPGVSELATLQSAAFGVPADRHVEVTRTMPGPDGTRMPHSLLTEIAAYGRSPRMGSPYCRKAAKESVVSSAWTPMVSRLKRELGRPVRILKVMGLRSAPQGTRDGPAQRPCAVRRLHSPQLTPACAGPICSDLPGTRPPLQWMKEMTMDTNPTTLLLDLAASAQNLSDRDALQDLLARGHRAWCQGVADVQSGIRREASNLSDAQLAERCAAAGTPWERGMTRGEAVSALAFATWDAAPAAMAYTELEERAALFGVCLLGEELL